MTSQAGTPATATIVFTDLVGSTAMRSALGEERADELRRVHDRLLGECVGAHGGRVVKGGGDGLLAAFEAASEAVAAAIEMQQAVARHNRDGSRIAELSVRIGLSAGDVLWEEGDCFGTPVVEAARLEAAAQGGQIVCSELVRLLARGRGGHVYRPLGELELKGLPDPVSAYEVAWEAAPTAAQVPFPPALTIAADERFVGRDAEQRAAQAVLRQIDRAAPSVVWLAGEPGIGKTRLAAELARWAAADGWTVLFGRCDEALAVPFQPFAEVLRDLVAHLPASEHAAIFDGVGPTLALLHPDLRRLAGDRDGLDGGSLDQFQLFEATVRVVERLAVRAPLMIVVDDVQWATAPTMLLLNHLARTVVSGRVAVVGTVRDTELPDELRAIIDETQLRTGGLHLRLGGLDTAAIAELTDDPDRAAAVAERSAGNPLFVRALLQDDGAATLGASVRRRLGRLGRVAQQLLHTAALIGLEFDVAVLARAVGRGGVLDALDDVEEAARAGLVEETGGARYRFTHALVRDALAEEVSETRRRILHRAIAEAFEAVRPAEVAALARHWSIAADDPSTVAHAVAYVNAAAEAALVATDYDGAARWYARALELRGDIDDELGARLAAGFGRARMLGGSHSIETELVLLAAAARAEHLGLEALWVDATIWGYLVRSILGMAISDGIDAIDRLTEVPLADPALRARVSAVMASAEGYRGNLDAAVFRARAAISLAESVGDGDALGWAHHALASFLPLDATREAIAHGRIGLANCPGGDEQLMSTWRVNNAVLALRVGDLADAERLVGEAGAIAERTRQPFLRQVMEVTRSMLAMLGGDLDAAEAAAERADAIASTIDGFDGTGLHGVQMFSIRREQGRLHEVAPAMRLLARLDPRRDAAWRPGLAALFAELDMLDEARAELALLVAPERGGVGVHVADDVRLALSLSYLVDACAAVDDPVRAAVLHERLLPLRGYWVTMFSIACYGPVDRYLGMAALTAGDLDRAAAHLDDALDACHRAGTPLWTAHTERWLAELAARRREPSRAVAHADAALRLATQHKLVGLERAVHRLLERLRP